MITEKLQKILANAGVGSRRAVEKMIIDGIVKVNGVTATLGQRINLKDKVSVAGKDIRLSSEKAQPSRLIIYHKPEGEICTRDDPEQRKTVFDHLPKLTQGRWISVGRLDYNTSGLLLFTNDGALANKLMHPRANLQREYVVRVRGKIGKEAILALTQGVELEDGMARFEQVTPLNGSHNNYWYRVILNEGRNRQVRRLFQSQDINISRLTRVRFGPIELPRDLAKGKVRELPADILKLFEYISTQRQ